MKTFQDKHIWIIGASSGIGLALAKEFSSRGASLMLSARSKDKLDDLNAELGGKHIVCPVDVSDPGTLQDAVSKVREHEWHIDSIVHLAALYEPSALDDLDIEKTRQILDVNVMGCFNLIHAVLPILQQQKQGQFAICGSVAGYRGLPNGQPYSASKAAVMNLVETLKAENSNLDIKLISPGFVRTPLTDKNEFKMPFIIEPEEAAKAIAGGLLKKKYEIHFPKKLTYIMKLLRLLPSALFFAFAKKSG